MLCSCFFMLVHVFSCSNLSEMTRLIGDALNGTRAKRLWNIAHYSTRASGYETMYTSTLRTYNENSAIILLVHMNSKEHSFSYFGLDIAGRNPSYSSLRLQKSYHNKRVEEQFFRSLFGCSLQIIIELLQPLLDNW